MITRFRSRTPFALVPAAVIAAMSVALTLGADVAAAAPASVDLGTADSFAVLGSSEVTNTGPTIVDGNLAVSTGTMLSGFPPGIVTGAQHLGTDAVGAQAKTDASTAYDTAAGATTTATVATELGGTSLNSGTYVSDTFGLTGTLTLTGDASSVWIFKAGSTITTASASAIAFSGGANACNVFWQIGSSATLGANSAFAGTVLAHDSISAGNGATVQGRLFALGGGVTLNTNVITAPDCPAPTDGGSSGSSSGASSGSSSGATSGSAGATDASSPATSTGSATAAGPVGTDGTSDAAEAGAVDATTDGAGESAAAEAKDLATTGTDQQTVVLAGLLALVLGGLSLLAARRRPHTARHRY